MKHRSSEGPSPAARRRLLNWFRRHQRQLPWRATRDPYAIWISEVMLQQTQVATVIDYFQRFLARFPRIEDLAAAPEQEVLQLWEGLGYYRRARQLHAAAQTVVREHAGRFPSDSHSVRQLPGIGRYTAGAVLSIAFDLPEPILEANTIRLFSRLLGYSGDPRTTAGQARLWQAAEAWLPPRGAGEWNQALMELGSLVCTVREPACQVCPLAQACLAHRQGRQCEIPLAAAPPRRESLREAALVVVRRGRVLLLRNPRARRWAGLWDFPRAGLANGEPTAWAESIRREVADLTGLEISVGEPIIVLRHGVTRFRITLECRWGTLLRRLGPPPGETELAWVAPDQFGQYPLNVTGRKLAAEVTRALKGGAHAPARPLKGRPIRRGRSQAPAK